MSSALLDFKLIEQSVDLNDSSLSTEPFSLVKMSEFGGCFLVGTCLNYSASLPSLTDLEAWTRLRLL